MATHIRDTVSAKQDAMTLSGYDKIWNVADAHRTPKKRHSSEIEGNEYIENYTWIAEDLPNLPVSQN